MMSFAFNSQDATWLFVPSARESQVELNGHIAIVQSIFTIIEVPGQLALTEIFKIYKNVLHFKNKNSLKIGRNKNKLWALRFAYT